MAEIADLEAKLQENLRLQEKMRLRTIESQEQSLAHLREQRVSLDQQITDAEAELMRLQKEEN